MAGQWSPPVGRVTVSSPCLPARWPPSRRPARASCGSGVRRGLRVRRCGCGWVCTPARRMCAMVTMSTTRRSTAVPGAEADLDTITGAEAVRLFAERASAVKPGFAVTAGNASAVAAVVRRLDGIALAVELAAARVSAMTPAELARRLERSFAVLAAGRRGAVARHQTLRATIDWSFQL